DIRYVGKAVGGAPAYRLDRTEHRRRIAPLQAPERASALKLAQVAGRRQGLGCAHRQERHIFDDEPADDLYRAAAGYNDEIIGGDNDFSGADAGRYRPHRVAEVESGGRFRAGLADITP